MKRFTLAFIFIMFLWNTFGNNITINNLYDAIKIGLDNNKEIKTKLHDVMSANTSIKSSLADLILPSINANFRFTTLDPTTLERSVSKAVTRFNVVTNVSGILTNLVLVPEEKTITNAFWDNYSAGATISYRVPYLIPLGLDLGYNSYILQIKNKELSELQYQKALNDYVYNITIAYYNYLFAKEFAKISVETDRRLEENVRVAEANFRAGIFSDLELIRARVQLVNNKPNVFSASNNLRIQKMNLITLLGLDVSKVDEIEIKGDIEDIKKVFSNYNIDFDKEKSKLIDNNIDLKILRKIIEISENSKNVALASNKPVVSLFFNYNYEFKKTNNFENERHWVDNWNAGIQINIPISELLPISKSYANMENADYSIEKSKNNYLNTINLIMVQFEQTKLRFKESLENILAQQANVEQAKRSLDIITTRYRFGNASSLDLIDAQLAYQQAELNLLSAWVNYVNTILNVKKLTGDNLTIGDNLQKNF
ncbi:MAG: TolC family protein [Brevinematales bacterium]|nr:TolC family protein [Brevinematales bacterium]